MTSILCVYQGDGRTTLKHAGNGMEISTDLPLDNGGKGRSFSPTDLFASSLASCSITIMGKMAESRGLSIAGTRVEVEKIMGSEPRRIAKIVLKYMFPDDISAEDRAKFIASIKACPVHNSLADNVEVVIK